MTSMMLLFAAIRDMFGKCMEKFQLSDDLEYEMARLQTLITRGTRKLRVPRIVGSSDGSSWLKELQKSARPSERPGKKRLS